MADVGRGGDEAPFPAPRTETAEGRENRLGEISAPGSRWARLLPQPAAPAAAAAAAAAVNRGVDSGPARAVGPRGNGARGPRARQTWQHGPPGPGTPGPVPAARPLEKRERI